MQPQQHLQVHIQDEALSPVLLPQGCVGDVLLPMLSLC